MLFLFVWICIALQIVAGYLGDMQAMFYFATASMILCLLDEVQSLKGTFTVTLNDETKRELHAGMHSWLDQAFPLIAANRDEQAESEQAAPTAEADVTAVDERTAPH